MDVDSLGKRFIVGFETIVTYKEFSKKVKDFLENYISGRNGTYNDEKLLDEKDHKTGMPYGECLNVIYAGGDDLFIVGHWDRFIDFAELIHSKTKEHFEEDCYMDTGGYDTGTGVKVDSWSNNKYELVPTGDRG